MGAATSIYFMFDIHATNRRLLAMERSTLQAVFPILQGMVEDSMLNDSRQHLRDLFLNQSAKGLPEHLFLLDADKKAVNIGDLAAGKKKPRRQRAPNFNPQTYLVMDFPMRAKPACIRCHGDNQGLIGYVRVATEHQERVKAISAHMKTHLAVLTLTMFMMGLWALGIVRRLIQAPLTRIVEAMNRVTQGRLDTSVVDVPPGELRAIVTGFNSMVRKLATDRREILDLHRQQVAHMERLVAVGEVAAHLAHEVRNPLTGISSAVQIMQQEISKENPRHEVLGKILTQINRMDQTMANFLSFARMPEAVVRSFDLGEPINRVKFLVEPRLKSQNIELRQRLPERLPEVMGDPNQLEQVFLNIWLNAIQAMPSGGTFTFSAKIEPQDCVMLEFADTGQGIPRSQLDQVFRPFFTTRQKGSGLGLPIARQIVMAHNGEIWIESVLNKGTSVFVRLPTGNAQRG